MAGGNGAASPNTGFGVLADSPSLASAKADIAGIATAVKIDANDIVQGIGQTPGTKHQRFTVASVPAGTSATQVYTWAQAFADANYTAVVTMFETSATVGLVATKITAQTAASITVLITNNAAGALTGSLRAIAIHD